jgi:DNA-binding GntR family transcriptional regulator
MRVTVSSRLEPRVQAPTRSNGVQAAGAIADRAYFELRDRIVTLRLPPGTSLREDDLMRELGIGRTPLREAIKRLALEHLVDVKPRRGTYVTDVEMAGIVHITEVRAELEGQAARLAATRMDNDARAETEALIAELEAVDSNDGDELLRLDERIHRLVWRASGNAYLAETLEGYFALSLRLWYVVLDRVPGLSATVHDQRQLLEALLARNVGLAGALMRDHVLAFQREVLVALSR